jgi:hypothetical protein
MTDELPQIFDDFARGVISPETFQHELLTLCQATPDRAWEALALLDQHFRRGKIARDLQQTLRHRIERQALGIENYRPEPAPAPAPVPDAAIAPAVPVAPDADAEDPTIETIIVPEPRRVAALTLERAPMRGTMMGMPHRSRPVAASGRWRPHFQISPAITVTAVMLAVATSPTVRDGQDNGLAIGAEAPGTGEAAAARSGSSSANSANQAERSPDMLSLSSDRYIVDPDRDFAEFSVERSPGAVGDTSFLWWTEGSGAKPDADYVASKPKRVQMAEGVGSSTLRIPLLANPHRRHVEMFYVLIGRPQGNSGVGPIHRAAVFLLPQHER